jgi:hypothetical protein
MEHHFRRPFIGHVFQQMGEKGLALFLRHDGAARMARFQIVDHGR